MTNQSIIIDIPSFHALILSNEFFK